MLSILYALQANIATPISFTTSPPDIEREVTQHASIQR
nr:MAG TPA: hypothetical protein [Caudoviricetes sp.]